jgi:hypothetical protein
VVLRLLSLLEWDIFNVERYAQIFHPINPHVLCAAHDHAGRLRT